MTEICKECGHENPKQFLTFEYISHAPDCSKFVEDVELSVLERNGPDAK